MKTATLRNATMSATIFAGLAMTALSTTASAGNSILSLSATQGPSRTVHFSDLNLAKMEDAAELHERISRAAHIVCRGDIDVRVLRSHRVYKDCLESAIDNAVDKVGSINLTMVHEGRGPALASK